MRIMVTGSRSFHEAPHRAEVKNALWVVLDDLRTSNTTLIHGGADGPDIWSAMWASQYNEVEQVMVRPDPQPGETYGHAAYRRNIEMLDLKPDLLVVCWDGKSRGTQHTTVEAAEVRDIPMVFVRADLVKCVYDLSYAARRLTTEGATT